MYQEPIAEVSVIGTRGLYKIDAKLISLNVGLPRIVMSNGDSLSTGIFKEPVTGRVMLTLNINGDRQADLSAHGGPSKAVYNYPSEHYDLLERELPDIELPRGMFGENFTTAGLFESKLNMHDTFRVGSAPRLLFRAGLGQIQS